MANNKDYYMTEKIDDSGVAPVRIYPTSAFSRQYEMPNIAPFVGNFLQGTSDEKYDPKLPSVEHLSEMDYTADEARAELQSTFNRMGNAIVNNAVIAGTSAISGTIGLIYGAIDAVANQELNRLYDNPVNRKMLEWQESTAKANPNYYTKDYKESSIWKKLGTSIFWADLIKNLGYTEGMMIPAMLTGGALSGASKAVQMVGSSFMGAASEASIEAIQTKKDKMAAEDKILVDEVNKLYANARTPEERQYISDQYKQALSQIENGANQAGNYVLGYNMVLLTATNALEWGKLFTRGNKASRAALLAKERSKGINIAENGLSIDIEKPWINTAKNLGERGYQAVTEGMEEVLQDIAVKSADLNPNYNSFNESIFNPEKRELADGFLQSLGMAFSQAMKDPETATNFAMGFFTSVIGSPRLRSPKIDDKWRSPITVEGGITEFIREKQEYKKKKSLVNEINNRMSDPIFTEYYNGLVRDMDLTEKANQALEAGDEFNFHNYQFASMISDIIMLDNVGQAKMLDNIIDRASNISDEEVQGLIDSGLFQQNGNPMRVEDAKAKIQENAQKMKELAEQYRETKEALEASKKGPEFSKDALENLIYAKMQLQNWEERQNTIVNELIDLYKSQIYDSTDPEAPLPNELSKIFILPKTREEFKKIIDESELTEDIKEGWNNKLNDLDKIQEHITEFLNKIKDYYKSPQKANEEQTKIKKNAVSREKKKKSDAAKVKLSRAGYPKELRRIYREIESEGNVLSEDLERAINELDEEDNTVVKENKKIQSLYQGTVAKLSDIGLDNRTLSDAISILHNAMDDALNIEEMSVPTNPAYSLMSKFYNDENPMSGDIDLDTLRFLDAQSAVFKALSMQLTEMNNNLAAARFTTEENPVPGSSIPTSTGSSGVTPAPPARSISSSNPAEITSENGEEGIAAQEIDTNSGSGIESIPDTKESQSEELKNEEHVDSNKSWFPLSWFFLGSKKKGKLVPISDTKAIQKEDSKVNFGQIPQWIEQNGVQEYIDSGNLKVGDRLVIGIPSDLKDVNGDPVLVYYKIDGENRIPVGIFSASGALAKSAKKNILKEYKNADQSKTFYSSITTSVNDIKTGYVEYGESKSVKASQKSILAIVKNGSLSLGTSSVKQSEIHRPKNISEKNGMVYIAIPNARKGMSGGYTLVGAKVRKFSESEFPLDAYEPMTEYIRNLINNIALCETQKDLFSAVKELSSIIYIPNLNFYLAKDGRIRVTSTVIGNDGKAIKVPIKDAEGNTTLRNKEIVAGIFDADSLFHYIYNQGFSFNVDKNKINDSAYNDMLFDNDIISSNAVRLDHTVGGWFTANPVDKNGEVKGNKIPLTNPTPANTPSSTNKNVTVTVNNKQVTLFSTGEYISLKDGTRKMPKDPDTIKRYKTLYNLQILYGDATEGPTMWNNKAVVKDRVIDRTTGEWVTGAAAAEVKYHIDKKETAHKTKIETQSTDNLFQNHDDMNPIEDLSENSKLPEGKVGYYLDSRDSKVHKTYMVSAGEILGTPVQIIKIPVLTSGLNSKGPKKLIGYNYGIVLPNGQSYIGANINQEEFPIDVVFDSIKKSFEGPGSGPKGQEFVEKHKKEFEELKAMPSVFPEESVNPIDATIESVEAAKEGNTQTEENSEMSFMDFATLMGADINIKDTKIKLRESQGEFAKENLDKALKWLNKVLPNIPVEVQKGLIHIAGTNAWGSFSQAGITLSDIAAEGTAYHEAFHAVFSLGLNGVERVALLKEAYKKSGLADPVEAEEWLAERFREYVMNQKSSFFSNGIKGLFRKLWNLIKTVLSTSTMRYSIYKKIASGGYSNINQNSSTVDSRLKAEEYTQEMMNILSTAKYDKNGNLLAPNGKPSNLNERQWVHVRTKAFKEWFGDWTKITYNPDGSLNIPKDVSKVVDENSEPKIMYHNTPFNFSGVFNMDHPSRTMPWTSEPFGHVGGKKTADTIKGTQYELFINLKNPLRTSDYVHESASSMLNELYKQGIISRDKYSTLRGLSNSKLRELMKELGYDGTVYKNEVEEGGDSYSFINPNQIKSATDNIGTYSKENNDIRLREIKKDNKLFLENGYSENWIENATEDEKRVARYCIGM